MRRGGVHLHRFMEINLTPLAALCAGGLPGVVIDEPEHITALRTLCTAIAETSSDLQALTPRFAEASSCRIGALLARRLLEQCALAVIGRLDPIRLVVAYRGAKSADFRLGERNESSFSWSRDVLPEFKFGQGHWSQSSLKNGPVRGLLDGHLATYLFDSTHRRVLDSIATALTGTSLFPAWIGQVQTYETGGPLLSQLRSRASNAYSALSKGVHFEFLGASTTDLSRQELATNLDSALFIDPAVKC